MARVRVTSLVAPYIDDINNKRLAGYTWSNLVDLLIDMNVIDKNTQAQTLRHATIRNPYAQYVEQRQLPTRVASANTEAQALIPKKSVTEMVKEHIREPIRPVFPEKIQASTDKVSETQRLIENARQAVKDRANARQGRQGDVVDLS